MDTRISTLGGAVGWANMYSAVEVVYFENLISQQSTSYQGICGVSQDDLGCSLEVAQVDITQEYKLVLDGAVGEFEALGSIQIQAELNGELNRQGQVAIESGIDDRLYGAPTSTTGDSQLDAGMPIRVKIAGYQSAISGSELLSRRCGWYGTPGLDTSPGPSARPPRHFGPGSNRRSRYRWLLSGPDGFFRVLI